MDRVFELKRFLKNESLIDKIKILEPNKKHDINSKSFYVIFPNFYN